MVYFHKQEKLKERVEKIFLKERKRILRAIPSADIQHIGSTAIPGSLTKGDLDIQVRVEQKDFEKAQNALSKMYKPNKGNPPTKTYASFKDADMEIPLGVQLTVIGSKEDNFTALRDILVSDEKHLQTYNALKKRYQGKSMREYRKAKGAFVERVLQTKPFTFSETVFENFWPLTNVKIGKILQKSGERIVCEISANEGIFVFKVADPSKTEEKIKLDTFVFDFLKAKSFQNIPTLLKTKEGENYQNLDGKFVYVMERIDGNAPERTPKNWARLGEIAAKLHDISDYPHKTLFTVESEMPKFTETATKLSFAEEYMTLVESLPNFSGLSTSLIHTDIGPHNAVQRKDGVIVLTDWDDAGVGTTTLDLGFPLICHFVTHELEFEKEKASAFYNAYFTKRNLPDKEKALIFDAGLFFALMYIPYGDTEKHWQRIKFAVENKELILSVLR